METDATQARAEQADGRQQGSGDQMVRRSSGSVGEKTVIDTSGIRVPVGAGGEHPNDRGGWQTVDHAESNRQRALGAGEWLLAIDSGIVASVQGVHRAIGNVGGRIGMLAVEPDARHHLSLKG